MYCVLIVVSFSTYAQQHDLSIFDGRSWGVHIVHLIITTSGVDMQSWEKKEKAFAALEKAVSMGYNSKDQYINDPDLNALHSDKRYEQLLTKLQ